jgi:uncharacterized protein YbaP (TraB family)
MSRPAALLAALLLLGPRAHAQPLTPAPDAEPTLLAELLVVGRPPGPAMWRVTRGPSEVIVMGSVSPVPHLLQWDKRRLERSLAAADRLLLPPEFTAGPLDTARMFVVQNALKLPRGQSLEASLPPPLRTRFVEARTRALQPAKRYERWKPGVAGFLVLSDWREAAGLSAAKPVSTVRRMLKGKRVKVSHVGAYRLAPLARSAARLSADKHRVCLEAGLNQNDVEAGHAQTVARAWAEGDVRTVRARYDPLVLESCLEQLPGADALVRRGIGDTVQAIQRALAQPGKTVAIVDMALLTRPDGVLERLQASGAAVTAPPDL